MFSVQNEFSSTQEEFVTLDEALDEVYWCCDDNVADEFCYLYEGSKLIGMYHGHQMVVGEEYITSDAFGPEYKGY